MILRRGRPWLALAGATVLALVVRIAYVAELQGTPPLAGLMGDSRQYDAWAQQIAGGQWVGTEIFYQTPLYPYWLAIIFRIAGHDLGLVRLIQMMLGAASCALLGLAGRRFFSDRVGVMAALLLAVYPPAFFFDGLIQKSSLDIFLVTLMLALLAEFRTRRDWTWLAALGVTTAAFVLNRENARVLYPVVGAWLLLDFRDVAVRRRVAWAAVFAGASLVVLLPVGFRNYRVGGEFLISTSQLGPNFYIGNNPHASGSYEPLVPDRGDPLYERDDAMRLASNAAGRALSPGEVSDYWLGQSFAYIRRQPFHWLALLGKKVLLTFNAAELPDTESIAAYADYSRILKGLIWLNLGVMLPLAVFGGWVHRAGWRRLLVLYGMLAGLAVAVALFYVVARYRHPIVPIVLLFSAAGLSGLLDMRLGGLRRWGPGLAGAGLVAIVANLPIEVVQDQTYLNLGSLLVQNGRPDDAVPLLLKAVSLDPGYAEPHFKLGLAYQDAGKPEAAVEELTTAVRLRPDHADAHNALGVLLRGQSKPREALPHFREAARYAPDSAETHTNLGLALMEAGQPSEAIAEHRRAIALAPNSPSPHNNLAVALQQAGDVPQAVAEYRVALAIEPDNAEAQRNLALALAPARDVDAVSRLLASTKRFTDLPLRAAGFTVREADGRLRVGVVVEPVDSSASLASVGAILVGGDGRVVARWFGKNPAERPLLGAMAAPPGTYRLRVVAIDTAGRPGAVEDVIEARLTPVGPLSLGSLILGVSRNDRTVPRLAFGSEPTAIASFDIYGGVAGLRVSATLEVARDLDGPALVALPLALTRADDGRVVATGAAPIGALPPGDYVVRGVIRLEDGTTGRVTRALRKVAR
jgi:Tfp pilus assembly protein PilF